MNALPSARRTASHIAIALPSGGSDLQGTHELLRDRIALWAQWSFILCAGFYMVNIITWPLTKPPEMQLTDMLIQPAMLDHLAASLMFAGLWLVAKRAQLSLPALRRLDACALIAGGILFAAMAFSIVHADMAVDGDPGTGIFAGLLASVSTVSARAIIVPSTAKRTLLLSVAAMFPLLVATQLAIGSLPLLVQIASWCAVSIAVATVGSRVIFGLRHEAARVRRLGQYTLEEKIGSGGMGVVYRASHAMLRRPTAIKLLPPDRAGESNLLRFEREVQITAELSHPNTVAIYDYGRTPDGIFYYAMEYLDGINLEELVRRDGPLPAGRVIDILQQVCGALAEAHSRGLLHRDIKPANIILTERGGQPDVAKVVDFGLVKRVATDKADVTMSASIVLAGTPLYMAPEALTAPDAVDPRADLYALGALGYFLLTGQPVFQADSIAEVLAHHLQTEPVPPSRRTSNAIPADLEALILRCLSKNVDDRPASARAMQMELARWRTSGWTKENAAAWWEAFRQSGGTPAARQQPSDAEAATVTVDVADRVAPR